MCTALSPLLFYDFKAFVSPLYASKGLNVRVKAGQDRILRLRFYFKAVRVKLSAEWACPDR